MVPIQSDMQKCSQYYGYSFKQSDYWCNTSYIFDREICTVTSNIFKTTIPTLTVNYL